MPWQYYGTISHHGSKTITTSIQAIDQPQPLSKSLLPVLVIFTTSLSISTLIYSEQSFSLPLGSSFIQLSSQDTKQLHCRTFWPLDAFSSVLLCAWECLALIIRYPIILRSLLSLAINWITLVLCFWSLEVSSQVYSTDSTASLICRNSTGLWCDPIADTSKTSTEFSVDMFSWSWMCYCFYIRTLQDSCMASIPSRNVRSHGPVGSFSSPSWIGAVRRPWDAKSNRPYLVGAARILLYPRSRSLRCKLLHLHSARVLDFNCTRLVGQNAHGQDLSISGEVLIRSSMFLSLWLRRLIYMGFWELSITITVIQVWSVSLEGSHGEMMFNCPIKSKHFDSISSTKVVNVVFNRWFECQIQIPMQYSGVCTVLSYPWCFKQGWASASARQDLDNPGKASDPTSSLQHPDSQLLTTWTTPCNSTLHDFILHIIHLNLTNIFPSPWHNVQLKSPTTSTTPVVC